MSVTQKREIAEMRKFLKTFGASRATSTAPWSGPVPLGETRSRAGEPGRARAQWESLPPFHAAQHV